MRGDTPSAVAFSADDRLLAIPAWDYGLGRGWDGHAKRESALLKRSCEAVAVPAVGSTLAGVGATLVNDSRRRGTGAKLVLSGHDGGVHDVGCGPDGHLNLVGADATIKMSDAPTGRLVGQRDFTARHLAADGRSMATAWSTPGRRPTRSRIAPGEAMRSRRTCRCFTSASVRMARSSPRAALGVSSFGRAAGTGKRFDDQAVSAFTVTPGGQSLVWG
jgi:hypothetical protein